MVSLNMTLFSPQRFFVFFFSGGATVHNHHVTFMSPIIFDIILW